MNKLFKTSILAVLLAGSAYVWGTESQERSLERAPQENIILGRDAVEQVRKDYEAGLYDSFLADETANFEEVKVSGALKEFAALRGLSEKSSVQEKQIEDLVEKIDPQDTLFVEKLRFVKGESFTEEEHQSFKRLKGLRNLLPGEGKTELENKLIDLDVEYEYKMVHVSSTSKENVRKKLAALHMEHIDKMTLLAKAFQEDSLEKTVEVYRSSMDKRLSLAWDESDLAKLQ